MVRFVLRLLCTYTVQIESALILIQRSEWSTAEAGDDTEKNKKKKK